MEELEESTPAALQSVLESGDEGPPAGWKRRNKQKFTAAENTLVTFINSSCQHKLNLTGLKCGLRWSSSLTDNNPENAPRFSISHSALLLLERATQAGPATRHEDEDEDSTMAKLCLHFSSNNKYFSLMSHKI